MENIQNNIHRRSFLKLSAMANGALLLGFNFVSVNAMNEISKISPEAIPANWQKLNAFIKISNEGLVTIYSPNPEIGQNVKTSMPMIVAEELGVDWENVIVEQAPLSVDFDRQVAGGSQSIRSSWPILRKAGATAREMLLMAAAKEWGIDKSKCKVSNGNIESDKGEKLDFGKLAAKAAILEVPEEVELKSPSNFNIIGKSKKNVDIESILKGQPLFGIDTKVEGMLYATAIRPPAFGQTLKSFDAVEAKKVNGVVDVLKFADNKIAILASSTWAAMKGKNVVKVEWADGEKMESSSDHSVKLAELVQQKSEEPKRNDGDTEAAFSEADEIVEKTFEAPFLPHNCMEPMNFFANVKDGKAETIGPIQTPKWTQNRIAKLLEVEPEKVSIMMTRMGGGFGRRLYGDFALEAAEISSLSGKPVQLVFSREDDMNAGTYRPASSYRFKAGIKDGELTVYHLTEACFNGNMFDSIPNYFPAGAIPNVRVDTNTFESNITTGAWRAPYTNFLAYAEQAFFDELAEKLNTDPIELRLKLFEKAKSNADVGYEYSPEKSIEVTKLAAEKAGWGKQAANVYQGFAMYYSHNTHVAEIADIVLEDGKIKVKKVTCAIHCGIVVNPIAATNQVEGGIIDGIGHALYADFSFEKGKPSASNFNTYKMIRMQDTPAIEVHFVKSNEDPTGLGEPSLPPAAGAIANAIFKATGKRLYKQPFGDNASMI